VGVSEGGEVAEIMLYPDPIASGDVLYLRWGRAHGQLFWSLLDCQGKKVQSDRTTMTAGQATLPLKAVPSGAYVLQLTDEDGNRVTRKLLVN
jgi:hypothetical protein